MIEIIPVSGKSFLQFNSLDENSLKDGELIISGTADPEVDKIVVTFENPTSSFPRDEYTLQTFKKGDKTFKYMASSRFQVLDFGENTYTVQAYEGKEVSETKIIVRLQEGATSMPVELSKDVTYEDKIVGGEGNSVTLKLPESSTFGTPISTGQNSFTYSNINGFEITKQDVSGVNCSNITATLGARLNTYFYWNTCRDIIKDKGISFYVISLSGDTYTYQKDYIDYVHGFYATYDIETGTGVDKDTIAAKNDELKLNNDRFAKVAVTDDLMKKIVSEE